MRINVGDYMLGDDDELVKVTEVNIEKNRVYFILLDDPNNAFSNTHEDKLDWYYHDEITSLWKNYGKGYDSPLWRVLNGDQ